MNARCRRILPLAVAALTLLATGCVKRTVKVEAAESPPYTFPHSVHVEAGLDCKTCHADIEGAETLGEKTHVALPSGDAAESCSACHETMPDMPAARPRERTIHFSHATHLGVVEGDCKSCHTQLSEKDGPPGRVPAHVRAAEGACTSCHDHAQNYAQAQCATCHVDLKRYPLKPVAEFTHQANFIRAHGQMAKTSAATCATCHDQTSCAECHAATTRPVKPDVQWPEKVDAGFIHRGDYVSRHHVEANADPASCRRCHGSSFCTACHLEQGIAPQGGLITLQRSPHPVGYGAGQVHGLDARRDIVSCASCHDQSTSAQSTCVACHRNVNPHPPGWGRGHNLTTDVASNGMCRTCHRS